MHEFPLVHEFHKCIYVLGLEYKYFLVGTIVRRGVRVEVGIEIHEESFCAETPDCELQRRQQAIFLGEPAFDDCSTSMLP